MTEIGDLWRFDLRRGNSENPREGACLLDAVSWFEYGTLGDHPPCVCPVIAAYARPVNDALGHADRQRLKVFLPRLVGTVDPESEQARAEYLAWQAIRVFAPMALRATGLPALIERATRLENFSGSLKEAEEAGWAEVAWAEAAEASRAASQAAARAAARAAWAAEAAWAEAAAEAARAAAETNADAMIAALDGVLKIGRQAEPMEPAQMLAAVERFDAARTA